MIGIFSNGWSASKSASLVMMQSAWPESASSRYMSSLGSRQACTRCVTDTGLILDCISIINSSLVSSFTYRSNFACGNTRLYSAKISSDTITKSFDIALSQDCLATMLLKTKALINTLQSKMMVIYFSFRSSLISAIICSRISGVSPFFSACSEASFMISDKLLLVLPTSISIIFVIDTFSAGVIFDIRSAIVSLTSKVIVFIYQR